MKSIISVTPIRLITVALISLSAVACSSQEISSDKEASTLSSSQHLGKDIFFDARLSSPVGQSCASCHSPKHGFSQPNQKIATAEGATKGLFGNRNVPSIAYIAFTPKFHKVTEDGETLNVGGFFLDGRVATLEDQATKPMLNPIEMGVANEAALVQKIKDSGYEKSFDKIYGKGSLNETKTAIKHISSAIADYERSEELSPFNSKYDAYLKGDVKLSKQELRGLKLFEAEDKGNCAACHPSKLDEASKFPPLFTDFTYDNLGVPSNKNNPFLNNPSEHNPQGLAYKDKGMGDALNDSSEDGKFKVSTLRNIALTAPYMHNGVFKTLKEAVNFYNTRDTDSKWAAPEVSKNVNKDELGDLKLSDNEVDDIVAFLNTLSDGYKVTPE